MTSSSKSWNAGVIPRRTRDLQQVRAMMLADGVAILETAGTQPHTAADATTTVLGADLLAYRAPVRIGTNPRPDQPVFFDPATRTVNSDSTNQGHLHVDGYMAFGSQYPDYVFLHCARQAHSGGESFVVDAARLVTEIGTRPDLAELARFLWEVPVEHSTDDGVPLRRPVAVRTPEGRVSVLRHEAQRVPDGTADDARLLAQWLRISNEAARQAPRFRLAPGEVLCLDNFRALHAREAYSGTARLLYRIWAWSDQGFGIPDPEILAGRPADDMVMVRA